MSDDLPETLVNYAPWLPGQSNRWWDTPIDLPSAVAGVPLKLTASQLLEDVWDRNEDALSVISVSVDSRLGVITYDGTDDDGEDTWTFRPHEQLRATNVTISFTVSDGTAERSGSATIDVFKEAAEAEAADKARAAEEAIAPTIVEDQVAYYGEARNENAVLMTVLVDEAKDDVDTFVIVSGDPGGDTPWFEINDFGEITLTKEGENGIPEGVADGVSSEANQFNHNTDGDAKVYTLVVAAINNDLGNVSVGSTVKLILTGGTFSVVDDDDIVWDFRGQPSLARYFDYGTADDKDGERGGNLNREEAGDEVGTAVDQFNLSDWDTSGIEDMLGLFQFAKDFNDPAIVDWDMSAVYRTRQMFQGTSFDQDIGDWDVSSVLDWYGMFSGDLDYYTNRSNTLNPFNQDIGGWDTSSADNMSLMFQNAHLFNQDIGEWNVTSVTQMADMFRGASDFNQDIGGWGTGNVHTMDGMFANADDFDQDISGWDITNLRMGENAAGDTIGGAIRMLDNSGMSVENFDKLLEGWSTDSTGAGDNVDEVPQEIVLGAAGLFYTNTAAYVRLTTPVDEGGYGWDIQGAQPLNADAYAPIFILENDDLVDASGVPIYTGEVAVYDENQIAGEAFVRLLVKDKAGYQDEYVETDGLQFTIEGDPGGAGDDAWFQISSTGELSLTEKGAEAAVNNFESAPERQNFVDGKDGIRIVLSVTAEDSGGNVSSVEVRLGVGNVNEAPTSIELSNSEVSELVAGAVIGDLSTNDPEGNAYTFSIVGDETSFEIVGDTTLKLKEGEVLDFTKLQESGGFRDSDDNGGTMLVRVEATANAEGHEDREFELEIRVNKWDEDAPTITEPTGDLTYYEDLAAGDRVAWVEVLDNVGIDNVAITGDPGGSTPWFDIDIQGYITLTAAGAESVANAYERGGENSFDLKVQARDFQRNVSNEVEVTLRVQDRGIDFAGNPDANSVVFGTRERDNLDTGAGRDVLTGDGEADIFVFKDSYGHDVIMDFTSDEDIIDLTGVTDITNMADLDENHLTVDDASGNALITYGIDGENSILLFRVSRDTLDADDFLFAVA